MLFLKHFRESRFNPDLGLKLVHMLMYGKSYQTLTLVQNVTATGDNEMELYLISLGRTLIWIWNCHRASFFRFPSSSFLTRRLRVPENLGIRNSSIKMERTISGASSNIYSP